MFVDALQWACPPFKALSDREFETQFVQQNRELKTKVDAEEEEKQFNPNPLTVNALRTIDPEARDGTENLAQTLQDEIDALDKLILRADEELKAVTTVE